MSWLQGAIDNIQSLVQNGSFAERDAKDEQSKAQAAEQAKMEQETIKAYQMAFKKQQDEEKRQKNDELHSFKVKKEQMSLLEKLVNLVEVKEPVTSASSAKPKEEGLISPTPDPEELAKKQLEMKLKIIADAIKSGFLNYGAKSDYDNPLATMSAEMAQAGEDNPLPDQYLPATMNLMETSGSKNMAQENNYFNWGSKSKPDINTAIDRIYEGVANPEGLYKDYLQSGELQDFFKTYTPSSDPMNPNQSELIKRYTQLRKYFPK